VSELLKEHDGALVSMRKEGPSKLEMPRVQVTKTHTHEQTHTQTHTHTHTHSEHTHTRTHLHTRTHAHMCALFWQPLSVVSIWGGNTLFPSTGGLQFQLQTQFTFYSCCT